MLIHQFQLLFDALTINGENNQVTAMFADQFEANLQAEKMTEAEFPLVVYENRITTTETFTASGVIQTTAPLSFMFLELDKLDSSPIQSDVIIQRMRTLAKQFVIRLSKSDIITDGFDIETFTLQNVYKAFDAAASGTLLTVTAPLKEDISYCV